MANAKLALEELYCLTSRQMNFNPEAAVIVTKFPPKTITYLIKFIATSQVLTRLHQKIENSIFLEKKRFN